MRSLLSVFTLVVAALTAAGGAQAPGGRGAAATPALAATDAFVFVLQDGVLYKFDAQTLGLLGTVRMNDVTRPTVGAAASDTSDQPGDDTGGDATNAPVRAALAWLVAHQDEDGRWDADEFMKHDSGPAAVCDGPGRPTNDVGVTGLATLALLGGGSTLRTGPHQGAVRSAVQWLRAQQGTDGLLGTSAAHDFIYGHAIATLALSEAYGLSKYKSLKPNVQNAINYLAQHRNPYGVWRYRPRDNDNDTSVTTWAWLACASARDFGITIDPSIPKMVATWYDDATDQDGRAGYTRRGEASSRRVGDHALRFPPEQGEALTAAALVGRFVLGQTPAKAPIMNASADLLLAKPPQWQAGAIDPYYYWFGTQAMYQMGGRWWGGWNKSLASVAQAQRRDGNFAGSWDPVGVWDHDGGRVYATALYALTLVARNRFATATALRPADSQATPPGTSRIVR